MTPEQIAALFAERDTLRAQLAEQTEQLERKSEAIQKLWKERDTLRAELDALQSGDELPELPKKSRGFFCTKCGSGDCVDGTQDENHPLCAKCNYLGFASDLDYTTDQMQSYARQAQAMARAKMLAELGKVEAVAVVDSGLIGNIGWVDGCELVDGQELYARPLPAQDVNAELVEALSASCHTEHLLLRGEVCRCSQCEFVRLRDTALSNAKAAQQKGGV